MPSDLFAGLRLFFADRERQGYPCRLVSEPTAEEEMPAATHTFRGDIHHVEAGRLQTRPTGFNAARDGEVSGFRFFIDGVQFSHLIGYDGKTPNVPLVYHLSAAAILQRDPETRELSVWRGPERRESLLVPYLYFDKEDLDAFGVLVDNTMDENQECPLNSALLRAQANSKSRRIRRAQEADLIREWDRSGEEGYLMVDGPLMPLPLIPERGRMVGVVKSSTVHYFQGAEQVQVMGLPAGYRTTAFQLPRGTGAEPAGAEPVRRAFTWYVRIRDYQRHDVDFGLVRVEIPPDPLMLAAADEISRWVIAERAPLSTPDPRWDNLLYPIHACERFLKSSLPERRRVHLMV